MRGFKLAVLGVVALLSLAGCGGAIDEAPVAPEPAANEVEALYACPIDRPCPGTTVCIDGLCRDCSRIPTPTYCL